MVDRISSVKQNAKAELLNALASLTESIFFILSSWEPWPPHPPPPQCRHLNSYSSHWIYSRFATKWHAWSAHLTGEMFASCAALGRRACEIAGRGSMFVPDRPSPGTSMEDKAECMAIVYSHPTWMVKRWLHRFGEAATESLLNSNNR